MLFLLRGCLQSQAVADVAGGADVQSALLKM